MVRDRTKEPGPGMELTTRTEGGSTVVALSGSVQHGDAARFTEEVEKLLGRGQSRFVFDFRALRYIDSTVLGVTIASLKRAVERSGSVRVVAPRGSKVRDILTITAVDRALEVFDTVEEALRWG